MALTLLVQPLLQLLQAQLQALQALGLGRRFGLAAG